jgi:ribose-phosphate pyrophosphokinase
MHSGEVDIRIEDEVRGKDVYFIQSCSTPCSDNVMETLLFISACRRSGAKRVTAVLPYFPFKHRRHGTIASTKYQSRFLASASMDFATMLQEMGVDRVVAVDLQRPGLAYRFSNGNCNNII